MRPEKRERLPQMPYQDNRCHQCWGQAKRFSSVEVPELLEYLAHRINLDQLAAVVRSRLTGGDCRCFFAPLSGVSICAKGVR